MKTVTQLHVPQEVHLCELAPQQLDEASDNFAKPEHIQKKQQGRHSQNEELHIWSQFCNI